MWGIFTDPSFIIQNERNYLELAQISGELHIHHKGR